MKLLLVFVSFSYAGPISRFDVAFDIINGMIPFRLNEVCVVPSIICVDAIPITEEKVLNVVTQVNEEDVIIQGITINADGMVQEKIFNISEYIICQSDFVKSLFIHYLYKIELFFYEILNENEGYGDADKMNVVKTKADKEEELKAKAKDKASQVQCVEEINKANKIFDWALSVVNITCLDKHLAYCASHAFNDACVYRLAAYLYCDIADDVINDSTAITDAFIMIYIALKYIEQQFIQSKKIYEQLFTEYKKKHEQFLKF